MAHLRKLIALVTVSGFTAITGCAAQTTEPSLSQGFVIPEEDMSGIFD